VFVMLAPPPTPSPCMLHRRGWAALCVRAGADITWGLLGAARSALGLTDADIAQGEEGPHAGTSSTLFPHLDLPPRGPLDNEEALQMAILPYGGGVAVGMDEHMRDSLCTLEDLESCVTDLHVCPLFALMRCVGQGRVCPQVGRIASGLVLFVSESHH
jgi:hypothetical protein